MRKTRKRFIKIFLVIIIIIFFTGVTIFLYQFYNYKQGKKFQEDKNYDKAISCYQKIKFVYDKAKNNEQECYYQKAIELRNKKDYDNSILYFEKSNNYNDSQEQIKETKYQQALYNYNKGNFEKSKEVFESIRDYKDVSKYLNNTETMISLQGVWIEKYLHCYAQIEGWKITEYKIDFLNTGSYAIENGNTTLDKINFYDLHDVFLEIENNQLRAYYYDKYNKNEKIKYEDEKFSFDKEDGNLYINIVNKNIEYELTKKDYRITKRKKPNIGMTKDEVLNSTWGKPEDINKTTTKYGTREQWCYSGYKYIYFEDGIVTSIQD